VRLELLRRFRDDWARARKRPGGGRRPATPGRTAGSLRGAAEARAEAERRREEEERARERARRDRERARARARYLDELAPREEETWRRAEALIETKKPKDYDQAVELVKDLYDLAERAGRPDEARARVRQLRQRHASKRSLLQRLDKAGLSWE
jgi:hypothetical protein